jgi:hypothetical protein
MRFKALPEIAQLSVVDRWLQYVNQAPSDLLYPRVTASTWLRAFRQLNVKIRAGLMPSTDCLESVSDLVDEWVHGPASNGQACFCCGKHQ